MTDLLSKIITADARAMTPVVDITRAMKLAQPGLDIRRDECLGALSGLGYRLVFAGRALHVAGAALR